ncbi:gluconokinase [Planosporangium thailandense]|uniref:Gluconokinase n=1 Tax=Planosporangium thailandense TaxID=765197 RepID=A0ABX0Y7S9_9ACTN|nr:gluconokinase [Planosporangium thailandense]NJC74141.1 gluconokinase [Planosporangium thailandense]
MAHPTVPIVVMGVAGCGKTTVGKLLAERLGVPYAEADAFHPPANREKMARGTPLTDDDRRPWLAAIGARIATGTEHGLVVSCSALKRRYRDVLRQADSRTWFLHLVIDQASAARRVAGRVDHFMPASLVTSQFEALEPLEAEAGLTVDATRPPAEIVTAVLDNLPAPAPASPNARTARSPRAVDVSVRGEQYGRRTATNRPSSTAVRRNAPSTQSSGVPQQEGTP